MSARPREQLFTSRTACTSLHTHHVPKRTRPWAAPASAPSSGLTASSSERMLRDRGGAARIRALRRPRLGSAPLRAGMRGAGGCRASARGRRPGPRGTVPVSAAPAGTETPRSPGAARRFPGAPTGVGDAAPPPRPAPPRDPRPPPSPIRPRRASWGEGRGILRRGRGDARGTSERRRQRRRAHV